VNARGNAVIITGVVSGIGDANVVRSVDTLVSLRAKAMAADIREERGAEFAGTFR